MNTPTTESSSGSARALLAGALSLLIPGAGQLSLGKWRRALGILSTLLSLAFLIQWAFSELDIGQTTWGSRTTSWLWAVLALFWLWNVFDAYRVAHGATSFTGLAVLLALFIVYYIGWQVTDANLDRLVTRFKDVRVVVQALAHPDLFVRDELGAWHPSENFGTLIAKIARRPAPEWLVRLGLLRPDQETLTLVPGTLFETIAIGLMATVLSTVLAIPLSFLAARNIMSRVPGGTIIYQVMRGFLNVVRSIDTLIWGILIVVWVGLGSFAGVLALTIHSIAALGKLYSEEIEHIDPGPIEALTASGANLLQTVRYAVIRSSLRFLPLHCCAGISTCAWPLWSA